jgi:hypothetical protein
MGVAAQNQGDCLTCGLHTQLIDIIRRMAHQDDGFVGDVSNPGRDRHVRGRLSTAGVIEPSKPEPASTALNGQVGVAKHCHAVVLESLADVLFTGQDVMIAKDGVSLPALEAA